MSGCETIFLSNNYTLYCHNLVGSEENVQLKIGRKIIILCLGVKTIFLSNKGFWNFNRNVV